MTKIGYSYIHHILDKSHAAAVVIIWIWVSNRHHPSSYILLHISNSSILNCSTFVGFPFRLHHLLYDIIINRLTRECLSFHVWSMIAYRIIFNFDQDVHCWVDCSVFTLHYKTSAPINSIDHIWYMLTHGGENFLKYTSKWLVLFPV